MTRLVDGVNDADDSKAIQHLAESSYLYLVVDVMLTKMSPH